ncbi:MAG: amidohydrolase family protein [Eubacterium sp.]|jgi:predicted TIM-barrel fold metal-dependent hydrolase|nr:amidohydrolase family protein [Eubacterium sp.]
MDKIIDFHTHAFADSIAARAMSALSATANINKEEICTDGTLDGLKAKLPDWGITNAVVLPIATKPAQQTTINNWAAEINNNGIFAFGTVHPDSEDTESELRRIKKLGLFGVKLHPDYQNFFLFEDRVKPLLKTCEQLKLPVIIHMAYDPVSVEVRHAMPCHLAAVSGEFPKLIFIGAHFGGMYAWEEVEYYLAGRDNVWLDTSFTSGYIDDGLMLSIIKKHGSDKILFGSDCPWFDPASEIKHIKSLGLSDNELDMIFYKSAEKLLKI